MAHVKTGYMQQQATDIRQKALRGKQFTARRPPQRGCTLQPTKTKASHSRLEDAKIKASSSSQADQGKTIKI